MHKPLEGIRVLDFSRLLPGPYCSLILSDLGAEVIKIEEPGQGDGTRILPPLVGGQSAVFMALNRGKKSVSLNLRAPSAQRALQEIIGSCDVVLEGFRPGVMDRLNLGYSTLSAKNPGLVYCSISGYGQSGPYRHKAGHDLTYSALGGILGVSGPEGGPPTVPGIQVADLAGGSWPAAVSILAALLERTRTGLGAYLDISLTDGALGMGVLSLAGVLADGSPALPERMPLNGGFVNYRTWLCKDGKSLALGALEPRFWFKFLESVGLPHLQGGLCVEGEAREQALGTLEALFLTRTRDEWVSTLDPLDVCAEPVLSAEEAAWHPLHRGRGMIREVQTSEGPVDAVMTPLPFLREEALSGVLEAQSCLPGAPELGAQGETLLRELGVSDEMLQTLKEEAGL